MPGRKYQANSSSSYRYSINGQEKESELNENITTALYWEYDSRIVRRWNVDPVLKDDESPYLTFNGNPILNSDVDGDDAENSIDGENDDEFKRLGDGTLVRIGDKGGDAIDYIYPSSQSCLICTDGANETLSPLAVETYYNPGYVFDEDDNSQRRPGYIPGARVEPGVWNEPTRVPASGQADQFDITDLIPTKGGGKFVLKAAILPLLKKPTKEFVEKKAVNVVTRLKTTTSKTYVKSNRTGSENTIKIIRPNGKQKLINTKRVKEFIPFSKAKNGLAPVNYKKAGVPKGTKIIDNSKGKKRTLTNKEKAQIKKVN